MKAAIRLEPPLLPVSESPPIPWGILALTLLSTISLSFPFYTTYIALPRMMVTLRSNLDTMQWVLTGFSIAQTVMMPMVGWLSQRFGTRLLYWICLLVTLLGSMGCGLAWNSSSLITWRIIQGLGAGPLAPLSVLVMFDAFPAEKRGMALGLISTYWAFGALLALPLGGYLVEAVGWRTIFFCGLPCGVASLALAWRVLPLEQAPTSRKLDCWGLIYLISSLVPFLFALSQGQRQGWESPLIQLSFCIAGIAMILFFVRELSCSNPLLDLRLFQNFSFAMICLVRFLNHVGFNAYSLLIALYLQTTLDYSPLQAGLAILPSALAVAPASYMIGRLTDRLPPRLMFTSGLLVLSLSAWQFAAVTPWTPVVQVIGLVALLRVSSELLFAPLNYTGLRVLPEDARHLGSGIMSLMWSVGGTVGNALTAVVLHNRGMVHTLMLGQEHAHHSGEWSQRLSELRDYLTGAGYTAESLNEATQGLLHYHLNLNVSVASFQDCFWLTAAIYCITLVPALFITLPKIPAVTSKT